MPPKRQYKPGTRIKKYQNEQISHARYAWLRTYLGQFIIMYRADLDPENEEAGPDDTTPSVQLSLTRPGGRAVNYNLTSLTREELDQTRQFFNLLFDLAEPLVDQRDKAAADAAAQGDDSFIRQYRQVPSLIVRPGALTPDSEMLRKRLKDSSSGAEGEGDHEGGVRGSGAALAPASPTLDRPEDNEPTTD